MVPPQLVHADCRFQGGPIHVLEINGAKVVPDAVDASHVAYVYDTQAGGWARPLLIGGTINPTVAGVAVATLPLILPEGQTLLGVAAAVNTGPDHQSRILGASIRITYDAAGAAADAGNTWEVRWFLDFVGVSANVEIATSRITVVAGQLRYYSPPGVDGWQWILPRSGSMYATVNRDTGTGNYPANTTCSGRVAALSVPLGAQLPG